jgi:hypothetical protein
MSRYDALGDCLRASGRADVSLSFLEIEGVIGARLPASAHKNRSWWGNTVRSPQGAAWMRAGWMLASVALPDGPATFVVGEPVARPGSGRDKILDGTAALVAVIERAGWPTVAAAVAAHVVFLDPATVAQTGGRAIVPSVRNMGHRRQLGELPDGRRVLFDDNASPTDAFLWAANRIKGTDVQFNHVWACASDPDAYTALWNLCCTPAFLAKATDSDPAVQAVLRYRSWELYGCLPAGTAEPVRPPGYETLTWHASPPPIADLEAAFRQRMRAAPGRGLVLAARSIGWAFSSGPDLTVLGA